MKSSLLTALCTGLLAGPVLAQGGAPVAKQLPADQEEEKPKVYEVGTQVPAELTFTDIDGKKLTMKELRGKTVVLTWYAYKCPAIKKAEPELKEMAAAYAAKDSEVVMIAIDSDKNELADAKPEGVDEDGKPLKPYHKLRTAMAERKINFRVFVDPGNVIADLFQAQTTPHMYVIDAEGVVRYSGALSNDPRGRKKEDERVNHVVETVALLQAGKEVVVTNTRPYG